MGEKTLLSKKEYDKLKVGDSESNLNEMQETFINEDE